MYQHLIGASKFVILLAAFLLGSVVYATELYPVGLKQLNYVDSERSNWQGNGPRPLSGLLWYPAKKGSKVEDLDIAIFKVGKFAIKAAMSEDVAKMPLIVISHGTGGSAATMSWLASTLSSEAYLVAAVNHHGNTAVEEEKRAEGFLAWWERPRDISVLIDRLLQDPEIGPRIDTHRIGVAGFSLGGYTAIALGGAKLNFRNWVNMCKSEEGKTQCQLPPEATFSRQDALNLLEKPGPFQTILAKSDDSYRDPRISAVFLTAPVLASYMQPESLSSIRVPVRIVVGDADDQAPLERNTRVFAQQIPNANYQVLSKVGHYSFLPVCSMTGKIAAKLYCNDHADVDRANIHALVGQQALDFFKRELH